VSVALWLVICISSVVISGRNPLSGGNRLGDDGIP
jgi:hypothetical protein